MKTATTALVALVVLGSFSIGCSSTTTKGEEVDTGTALSSLRSPTGSFSKASGAGAFAGYRSKRADSATVSAPGVTPSGGGTSSTSSIRLLDRAANSQACSQGQACACPNGGSMSYSAQSSAEGQLVRVKFEACGFEDGLGFDGDAILLASTKSLLGIVAAPAPAKTGGSAPPSSSTGGGVKEAPSGASGSSNVVSVLLAARGTATDGTRKLPLEFALLTEAHYAFLAVSVPDGNIVIGVSDDGNAIVRSKEGTWRCQNGARGWACTSEQGERLELAEQGASDSDGSSSPAPSPSSPSGPSGA